MAARGFKTVKKAMADGSVKLFFYHRETGARLPGAPGEPEFERTLAKLHAEAAGKAEQAGARTINWLAREYQKSQDWKALGDYTREIEAYRIEAIETKFGTLPLEAVEERGARGLFLGWHDDIAEEHPRSADAHLARLAKILAFGVERELLLVNPISTFKRAYKGSRSDIIWLPEHIAKFQEQAGAAMGLALDLAFHTGQRRGDILALLPHQYDGSGIKLVQSKTKREVYVPCTSALKAKLDALNMTDRPRLVVTRRNEPMKIDNFKTQWRRTQDEALGDKTDLHFHDLRGTAVTMLAEAGCSVPEIVSITGHSLESATKILERYLSRTRELAHAAIAKLDAHQNKPAPGLRLVS